MRYLRMVIPVFVLALAASACGGDDAGEDENGASGELTQEEAARAFNQCMRDHGVDQPDGEPGQVGIQRPDGDPTMERALAECRDLLPDGGGPMTGGDVDPEDLEKLRTFAACMRENGIDMADPGPDGMLALPEDMLPEGEGQAQVGGGPPANLDPEYLAAMEECQEHLAGAPVRIGGGGR